MARVPTSGGSLGYAEAGGGERTPLVFLHGVGSDKSVWRPQLDHFAAERRALAFDYPGYGESDPAPEGTTRDDYAAAILSAMAALGIARAHVCGLSLGGVVAIAVHHAAPEACASLILADSFAAYPEGQAIYDRSIAASSDMRDPGRSARRRAPRPARRSGRAPRSDRNHGADRPGRVPDRR